MTDSLRALLAGAIDYAGMYPPASLPLEQAVANYRRYRADPEAWMLGRFVCPAAKLAELTAMGWGEHEGRLAVIVPPGDTSKAAWENLSKARLMVSELQSGIVIDTLEFRLQSKLVSLDWRPNQVSNNQRSGSPAAAWVESFIQTFHLAGNVSRLPPPSIGIEDYFNPKLSWSTSSDCETPLPIQILCFDAKLPLVTTFMEVTLFDRALAEPAWRNILGFCVAGLARSNIVDQLHRKAGLKFRTGGVDASAVPTSAELAAVICACRNGGVFWKATAGLHHPFRHRDEALGADVHGFINVLGAAVLADVHRLDESQTQAILDDSDPEHFRFSDDALAWREWSVTTDQIGVARQRSLQSFGSCSFDDPRTDLRTLGLL